MVCGPTSGIFLGCLLLLIFSQGSGSRNQTASSESCTSPNCNVNISCIVINLEYMDCNWTRPEEQDVNYTFSSLLWREAGYQECQQYLKQNGQNVGCRIPFAEKHTFHSFSAKLFIGRNQSVFKKYEDLRKRVKLNPPFNLSLERTEKLGLCLHWESSIKKPICANFSVRYQKGFDQWQIKFAKDPQYCIPFISTEVNVTFLVRSKTGVYCGESHIWSDWSDPIHWGNYTESSAAPAFYWQLWPTVLGATVLIALAVLLFYCERIRGHFVIPDPSKNLQDLFHKHNGNVESWVYISRELKEAFEPDYTESPCVVCEPSPTLKGEGCNEAVKQPS